MFSGVQQRMYSASASGVKPLMPTPFLSSFLRM
jgi:hypothetical protein